MLAFNRPLSKAEKSLFIVCGLSILPLIGVVYISGVRDADPKWDIPPAAQRPIPNGYDSYVAATKATVRFTPEVDPASDTSPAVRTPGSPYALKNYSLARRQQWLKANARTFVLADQGLKTPSMVPKYSLANQPQAEWSSLRQLARDMTVRTLTFQMQRQPMRATMSALDVMQMGQDTMRGGGMKPRLISVAIMRMGRTPIEDWNKTINALNASEARASARRLEAILAKEPPTSQTLTVDKADTLDEMRRVLATPDWRGPFRPQKSYEGIGRNESLGDAWQRQTISKRAFYANMNHILDVGIAETNLPYLQVQSAPWPTDVDAFTIRLGPISRSILRNDIRNATSNNMLLLRLALRAYIAEHASAPPTLSALALGYLKSIPTDAYNDGKPLFYHLQGKSYKLWSVGPDGINNGGIPLIPRGFEKSSSPVVNTLDNKGDFVAGLCR